MKNKCRDCGEIFEIELGKRADVCNCCYENRMWLVENLKAIGLENMQKAQAKMRGGSGNAKRFIEELKK